MSRPTPADRPQSSWQQLGSYVEPIDGELLSSFLVRLAHANLTDYQALGEVLGLGLDPNQWVGIEYDEAFERDLMDIAGITKEQVASLHVDQTRLGLLSKHAQRKPTQLSVCPSCIDETGGWQRRWADPWNFVCHQHALLLITADHAGNKFKAGELERHIHETPWREIERTQTPSPRLVELQVELDQRRMQHPADSPWKAERMLLRLTVALRDAVRAAADDAESRASVEAMFEREITWLEDLGYDALDPAEDQALYGDATTPRMRIEHTTIAAPLLVRVLADAQDNGSDDALEDARSELVGISGKNRKASPSVADPWDRFVFQKGVRRR